MVASVPDARRTPNEQLAFCTVRIECEYSGGNVGTGTGFFYSFASHDDKFVPAIVTNKHVIANSVRGRFHIHTSGPDDEPAPGQSELFQLDDFEQRWLHHPDPTVDLCAMPIAPMLLEKNRLGKALRYVRLDMALLPTEQQWKDLTAIDDVIMIGYPIGIWDSTNNMPIVRRGVTATHPAIDYEGRSEFLIDAACFPGSSGSPVFIYNTGTYGLRGGSVAIGSRLLLLGILYAGPQYTASGELQVVTVPTAQDIVVLSRIPTNLGLVIRSSQLTGLDDLFRKELPRADSAALTTNISPSGASRTAKSMT